MMKIGINVIIALLLFGMVSNASGQTEVSTTNTWKTLAKITYKKEYDELMGFKVDVPVFSEDIKNLAGKEISIKGYIIPV